MRIIIVCFFYIQEFKNKYVICELSLDFILLMHMSQNGQDTQWSENFDAFSSKSRYAQNQHNAVKIDQKYSVFIVSFEPISHLYMVFLLLTLNR